jgi:hydroxypyruvate reductase
LEVIASGPTVLEDSLKQNPQDVIRKFDPDLKFTPASVLTVLGQVGRPDVASSALNNPVVHNRILCNNQTAVAAAAAKAAELGYECELAQTCDGSTDATQLGQELADQLVELTASSGQRCIISGGEPTVTLPPNPGAGGRNQHLVLAALQRLSGVPMGDATFCLLSGGTDGEDGNVPVAGAWLDSGIASAEILDEVSSALNECDSYRVFRRLGRLLRVPPTRTNVCDLRVLVSEC